MSGFHLELNSFESFCFYLTNLANSDNSRRLHVPIPDTLIFKEGRIDIWLFTSQKSGVSHSGEYEYCLMT